MQFGKHATITFIKGLPGAPDDELEVPSRVACRRVITISLMPRESDSGYDSDESDLETEWLFPPDAGSDPSRRGG